MSPSESRQLTDADLEAQTREISEETQTVADDILLEVKECQRRQNEQTAALERLQEIGATREQVTEALILLQNTRQEMTELMREMRETLQSNRLPSNTPPSEPPNPSPESQPLTPSTPEPLETINPENAGGANREEQTRKRKRRIL